MCQRLYIASFKPISRVRRTKANPFLDLRPCEREVPSVQELFPDSEFPNFYIAGGYCPCGCGFPEELSDGRSRVKDDPDGRKTMARLAAALRPVVSSRPRVQLYLCFEGDEDEEPKRSRNARLDELTQPDFRLENLEVVTILKGGVEQPVAADERRGANRTRAARR